MYNEEIMNRFLSPKFAGALKGANAVGSAQEPKTSEVIRLFFSVDDDGAIKDAKFKAFGSPVLIALGDATMQAIIGINIKDLEEINEARIINLLKEVPQERFYMAFLIVNAINDTIDDYYKRLRRLEKKMREKQKQANANISENSEVAHAETSEKEDSQSNVDYSDLYEDEE